MIGTKAMGWEGKREGKERKGKEGKDSEITRLALSETWQPWIRY